MDKAEISRLKDSLNPRSDAEMFANLLKVTLYSSAGNAEYATDVTRAFALLNPSQALKLTLGYSGRGEGLFFARGLPAIIRAIKPIVGDGYGI